MMRVLKILSALFLLCAVLASCQKEFEDPNDPSTSTASYFKANINGVQFVAVMSGAAIGTDSVISLAGKSDDGQQIIFSVLDSGAHVYSLDINSISNIGICIGVTGLPFTSNGGATSEESGGNLAIVSINTVNRVMSGTFNFKAFRQSDGTQKIINDGVFNNISY